MLFGSSEIAAMFQEDAIVIVSLRIAGSDLQNLLILIVSSKCIASRCKKARVAESCVGVVGLVLDGLFVM